ncbi:MAG: hypothetical protein PWQ29_280 [Verrucomicrobiota bacterium]|jgi:hypothetical protein|nr:hypothetical protein [Verrucomicrobiota bacterium]MDK2962886.1 hypothetical protein [Verrucomicrobiota bacterium]
MATLGQQLKAAREAKGVSESEAGTATKILTKLIVDMEADDFSGMAAPTYAKGFIRLYARYLGLDPEPLVDEYNEKHAPGRKPFTSEERQFAKRPRKPGVPSINFKRFLPRLNPKMWFGTLSRVFSKGGKKITGGSSHKTIRAFAVGAAVLLILIVLIVSIANCARRYGAKKPEPAAQQAEAARRLLDEPLPDLYLVEPNKIESSP